VIYLIIVDNYCNFTCLEEALEVLEALGEWEGIKSPNLKRKNKLIRQHITNFWAYPKLQLHNKSERLSEGRPSNSILIKEVIQKNLKFYQVHMMCYQIQRKGNCTTSMERKAFKMEDHQEAQALETCLVIFSEEEKQIKAQEKESQDLYKLR